MSLRCCQSRAINRLGGGENMLSAFWVSAVFDAFSTHKINFALEEMGELLLHFGEVEQRMLGGFAEVHQDVDVAGYGVEVGAED